MRDEEVDSSRTPTSSARCGASPSSCTMACGRVIVFDGGVPALKERAHPPAAHAARAPRGRRAVDGGGSSPRGSVRCAAAQGAPQNTEAAYAGGFDPGARARPHLARAPAPRPAPTQPSPESSSDDDDDDRRVGARRDRGRPWASRPTATRAPSTSRRSSPCRRPCARRASRPSTASSASPRGGGSCPWPGTPTSSRRRSSRRSCGARRSGSASSGPRLKEETTTRAASASTPIPSGAFAVARR